MYIRRVRVPRGARKPQNIYYNLIASVCTPKVFRQRLVLSLLDIYGKLGLSGKFLDRQLMKYKISGDNRKS